MNIGWTGNLADMAAVSRKATLAVMGSYRRGGASTGGVLLKDGDEVQLPADRLGSEAGVAEMRLRFGWQYVDEEVPETHDLLDARSGKPITVSDWLDGSGVFQTDDLLPAAAPTAGFGNTFGIVVDGVVKAGIMVQPARGQLFYGAEGSEGCHWLMGDDYKEFLASGKLAKGTVLRRDPNVEPLDAKQPLALAFPQGIKMSKTDVAAFCAARMQLADHKLLGSEKAEGCAVGNSILVILQQVAAYLNYGGGMAWDLAVPLFLAELSGCVARTVSGEKITWSKRKEKIVLARDATTMKRLLDAI